MSKNNVLILDADSLIYMSANKDTINEAINSVDYKILGIKDSTKCEKIIGFITEKNCFRYKVDSFYKYHRKVFDKPKFFNTIKNYLIEQYGFSGYEGLEADDLVAITRTLLNEKNIYNIIASTDKDVLNQIEGDNFDYYIDKATSVFRGLKTTSEEDSIKFLFKQCLMGDSTDNIEGIKGIGEVKASAIIENTNFEEIHLSAHDRYLNRVLDTYNKEYKDKNLALKNFNKIFRLVYILRTIEDCKIELNCSELELYLNHKINNIN